MKKISYYNTILIICLLFTAAMPVFAQKGTIKVTVANFENNEGTCFYCLYNKNQSKDFPTKQEQVKCLKAKIANKQSTIQFENLDFGTYAIAIYHDENDNGKLDTNFIGIPKEGMGASNNAKAKLGPPKFEDAKFEHQKNETVLTTITLSY